MVDEADLAEWRRHQCAMTPTLPSEDRARHPSRPRAQPSQAGADDGTGAAVDADYSADYDEDEDDGGYSQPALDSFDGGQVGAVFTPAGPRWTPEPRTGVITWNQFRKDVSGTLTQVCPP